MKKNFTLLINNLFNIFSSLNGSIHWSVQRVSAIVICLLALISFFSHSLYMSTLFLLLITPHVFVGIQTLIEDYIHDTNYSLIIFTSLRLIVIFFFKTINVLFLC
uniref:succinate dehydrogenase subunit 4 n=1 Tax=Cryptomonas gyropyrenoidosa TaxID=233257 RepID=UPI0027A66E4E|nr:succinate dehydrogenase subunit 4 [Cryptomonas gyropyrenoidosa]WFQ82708.1 succinate dehydrogenase subunit 4 [Cryptomonas gyropyrenoidosa]